MKKKLWIALFALISSFSVGYAFYHHEMSAASSTVYHVGGTVTGRVNIAPSGISSGSIGMQKGDKILMGTSNPLNGSPLSWVLIKSDTYNDYGCTSFNRYCNAANEINAWASMTTEEVANTYMGLTTSDFIYRASNTRPDKQDEIGRYANSNIYQNVMKPLNQSLSSRDKAIIAPRNLKAYHDQYFSTATDEISIIAKNLSEELFQNVDELGSALFLPESNRWGFTPFSNQISQSDAAFSK